MITVLSLTLLGFFLGMRHATDPDHIIAVSTIVSRQPTVRGAILIGALWGVGHTVTIVAVGIAIVLFAVVIPPKVGLSMEMAVALMLIVLGMWNLAGFIEYLRGVAPAPGHSHGPFVHAHRGQDTTEHNTPAVGWLDSRFAGLGPYQILRPLLVGLVHGLAGSAAVALLVLALIKNPWWALAYLVVFGIGTIGGMMLITAAMGAVISYASRWSYRVEPLRLASGLLSLAFGVFLAYEIAIVDGLVTGTAETLSLR